MDYIVIDYMKNMVGSGDYFVVKNKQGKRKKKLLQQKNCQKSGCDNSMSSCI